MEYNLLMNDKPIAAEVAIKQDNQLGATIKVFHNSNDPIDHDRRDHDPVSYDQVSYNRLSDHQMHLTINGRQITAWVENQPMGKTIIIGGERFFIQDKDKLAQTTPRKTGPGKGSGKVTPPMPAVVISVPVQLGNLVKKGDTVVVVSAMKMETSLTAPHNGTITRIGVNAGDKVMPGDILIDIEKGIEENIEVEVEVEVEKPDTL